MAAGVPTVRFATRADLDSIVDVYLSNARHHAALEPRAYRVPPESEVRARFAAMLDADDADAHLVAEVDGLVVGAADVFTGGGGAPGSMRRPARTAEIGLAVLDEWRGRGIGTALVVAAEEWARAAGLDAVILEVASANDGARRLYERLGYRPVTQVLAKRIREE